MIRVNVNITIVRTLRDLLTEYDSALYTIREPFSDPATEQRAVTLRATLQTTAQEVYDFLAHYEKNR